MKRAATRNICPATAFLLLFLYIHTFRRYRVLWREYCELAESYAGVHAGLLWMQQRDATRHRGRDSSYGALRARNIATPYAPRVAFSDN